LVGANEVGVVEAPAETGQEPETAKEDTPAAVEQPTGETVSEEPVETAEAAEEPVETAEAAEEPAGESDIEEDKE
jgi:outer membrane biosynthesis protein TonB